MEQERPARALDLRDEHERLGDRDDVLAPRPDELLVRLEH